MERFVHLHVHSEYSLLDGAARIEELAAHAAELGMTSLALTDHGVMYGAVPFYKVCTERGIKPIIGCEVYFTSGSIRDKGRQNQPVYHLILLAKNETGYQNLMKLISIGHMEGFHYKPRIDAERLAAYAEGLICLSSCLKGEISQHLLHARRAEAKLAAERYRNIFGDDFFLELQDHGLTEQKNVMRDIIALSRETGIPLIATNNVHYIKASDRAVQDVLVCIGTGKTVDDADRLRSTTDQLYLKSGEEMRRLFAHVPEALTNTAVVADRCNLLLEFGRSIMPEFRPIPEGLTAGGYLAELCRQGLTARYGWSRDGRHEDDDGGVTVDASYRRMIEERLQFELTVIEKMGYSDYFLIVWDFIRFAHERGIATGPGRGSSAGSLVAYTLKITDVDPIRYGLLFERFLNPERVSMPDIDIDFDDLRREEVIAYVVEKYGKDHVAQIITFGTMAAKAALRDVGRVMNVPYNDVDRVARMITGHLGITLQEAITVHSELKALAAKQPKTAELLDMAMRIEGLPRHMSTHASGIVISREPLTRYVPLQEGAEGTALTQYAMEHLEAIGLLKMDFLGVRMLSIIERTLRWIRVWNGIKIDLRKLPENDPATYAMLCRGETAAVFQLESAGYRRLLKEMKPSVFEDIITVGALYRPGPMEYIPKYIRAKHREMETEYPHPSLEPILRDTYGIILYQEQIMHIAAKMAGFSLGEADLLLHAVRKKKREVMNEERARFIRGSLRKGHSEADANKVYDMIVRFADYGFPRAHAAAYAVMTYRTAWLKAHYPVPFMAATLTSVMGNHRKAAEYVDECRRMRIAVLPPDVNESIEGFTPVYLRRSSEEQNVGLNAESPDEDADSRAIRFGLAAIKNVGTQAIEAIIRERKSAPYEDLLDFCRRVDLRACNKRVIESLISGGAFDSLPGHRAQLLAVLERMIEAVLKWKKDREELQLHLVGLTEEVNWTIEYPDDAAPYTQLQKLALERELLGMFISGHPLDAYEPLLHELDAMPLHQLAEEPAASVVIVAGMIVSCKNFLTQKGQAMAFVELEDRIEKIEVVIFPEIWTKYGNCVQKERLMLIRGKLQQQDAGVKLLADRLTPLDEPRARETALRWRTAPMSRPAAGSRPCVFLKIDAAHENTQVLSKLKQLLQQHKGPLGVILFYERSKHSLSLSEQYSIKPSPQLFQAIEALLGPQSVKV